MQAHNSGGLYLGAPTDIQDPKTRHFTCLLDKIYCLEGKTFSMTCDNAKSIEYHDY